jgi:hypothetical protein
MAGVKRQFGMSDLRSTTHWQRFFSVNGIYSKSRKLLTLYYVVPIHAASTFPKHLAQNQRLSGRFSAGITNFFG